MIYLVGGAPRTGKSILTRRIAGGLQAGWVSTDLLLELLRVKNAEGIKTRWDASADAIRAAAEWFFPYLERFVRGTSSMADNYVIEGVDFLPEQVMSLSRQYPVRSVFLGCSAMTSERFDHFPGHSPGYSRLPEPVRNQMARDVPIWSEFIRRECEHFGYPYVDVLGDFSQRLHEAEAALTAGECSQVSFQPPSRRGSSYMAGNVFQVRYNHSAIQADLQDLTCSGELN